MPQFLEHSGTSWKGQRLKHAQSPIDRIDPRVRVIVAFLFALVVVSSSRFSVLLAGLGTALLLAGLAHLNFKRTLRRVVAMDMFMIFLVIMLPFTTPGEALFTLAGIPASTEGMMHAFQIALKANAVVLCLLSLVGTMSATTLGHALARLHVPDKLVHLLLFTVRYLDVIGQEYKRMRRAMQARAFVLRSDRHTWCSIGYLVGMLLVRSLERSERIADAMKCRGYNGRFYLLDEMVLTRPDFVFIPLCTLVLGALTGLSFI
ncbi:cobalt ECF transporter T component CbiQ [Pontibacterium granulatum]|uniref:cobalt ECF transporter T component CbiQ n=1 Tax=Pontibacterium granulatum TaxID=2036029 RepID=UPI00249AB323|nr:cobalt ECF transporter T component CbiQ [Pontibacterium granulatum]MDI3323969.1 cobalt ECF transporter T component CbiQ [Pontibacterium granulatum]